MNIFKASSENLKQYANENSQWITTRENNNGNSNDMLRKSTKTEQQILEALIYGALLAIRSGTDVQCAKDTAEYIGLLQLPDANCYLSVYLPITGYDWDN
jgi:hypothetical protein